MTATTPPIATVFTVMNSGQSKTAISFDGLPAETTYDCNIVRAAHLLVNEALEEAIYQTQWSSGATLWKDGDHFYTVERSGKINVG